MLELHSLNWLAVLVATIASFLLGGIWYGPLFGKAWMTQLDKTEDDLGGAAVPMGLSFFTALVTSIALAILVRELALSGLADGITVGLFVGIGFIATSMASDYAFCGWSLKLFWMQAGYRVVYSVIMGLVLCLWQ